jgi:menaquinone-dependent protoporphyrinogen IX oxidase
MRIQYVHASKYGNGAQVAAAFADQMAARGSAVEVHHMREVDPARLPVADLYVFSSPGRFGKPIRRMRRFLARVELPGGTRYAIFTTEMQPKPDPKTGRLPTEEELARWQKVRPVMDEILLPKGLVKVTEGVAYVTGLRGPLEDTWRAKVEAFATSVAATVAAS